MHTLVVFEFPFDGPWGEGLAAAMKDLAADIAGEKGLAWKVWTEAPDRGTAGGVYLFDDAQAAEAYIRKHSARLQQAGIRNIDVRRFAINAALSRVTGAAGSVLSAT